MFQVGKKVGNQTLISGMEKGLCYDLFVGVIPGLKFLS